MSGTPKFIRYSSGLFKLRIENLPLSVQKDKEHQNKLLSMLHTKYANYSWGDVLPEEKINEMNRFIESLVKDLD